MSFWTRIRRAESIFRGYAATSGAWIRFDQSNRVTLSGSTITRVVSDEGRNLVFTNTVQPLSRSLNGLNSADFNGSTMFLTGTVLSEILGNTGSLYIDSVMSPDTISTGSVYNSSPIISTLGTNRFILGVSPTGSNASVFVNTFGDRTATTAFTTLTGTVNYNQLNWIDKTSINTKLNSQTASLSVTTDQFAGNYTGVNLQIGKSANSVFFDGRIGEILIRGNNPPDTGFQTLRDWWVSAKWGANQVLQPNELSNLLMWFDSTDSSTITLSGNFVTQWNDKSGNNLHLVQNTASNRPTYVSNDSAFGNLNSIWCSGSVTPQFLLCQSNVTCSQISIIGVVQYQETTAGPDSADAWFSVGSYANPAGITFYRRAPGSNEYAVLYRYGTDYLYTSPGTANTRTNRIGWVMDSTLPSSNQSVRMLLNGTLGTITVRTTGSLSGSWIGTPAAGINPNISPPLDYNTNIKIAEVLVYNRALSAAELANLDQYLKRKYALP